MGKERVAIVVSHPIQHFCPQYVSFAENKEIELKVFFGSTLGYKKYVDENFKHEISWNNLQLDRFEHHFLNGDEVIQPDKDLDAPTLEKQLEIFQPTIVFSYGYFQKLQRRARRWALKNKVPVAYISDSELRHLSNPLKNRLKSFFLRQYFSRINYFLSMGNANETYYAKHGVPKNKILRMHYPLDLVAYNESYKKRESLRTELRNEYKIQPHEIVLTVVGKLVPWKNQDHVIRALQLLEEEEIYLHLFILGSGEKSEAYKQLSSKLKKSVVYFPGFVDIDTLPKYYAATDIYVHPASLEPHSVAISEAIFMGCPIILSDRCGSYGDTDDVQEGKNGFVYEFGNIKALAEKIKVLAGDEKLRESFSEYSHSIASRFQHNAHFDMMNNLVKKISTQSGQ